MRVSDFDFDLPEELIALRPAVPRDSARLLHATPDALADRTVIDLPDLLQPGDALVFNDTRVIPAQLTGRRGDATIGITLHKREDAVTWLAFLKNARRARLGDRIEISPTLAALVEEKSEKGVRLRFEADGPLEAEIAAAGTMPLPPYIASKRRIDERDGEDYQTMFARREGAVAAPTASLHFTPRLLEAIAARGVLTETLTLHVGAGTFLPVKAEDTEEHSMHAEWGELGADAAARLNEVRARGGRIVAAGTTSLRLLESAAGDDGLLSPFAGDTDIFITPGYRFRAVGGLMTNFHLPRSTLFMLVSALMGLERMHGVYDHAIKERYRFYSYGDSSLLMP
ncbi:tRNA preQ1(34) S-adenosylmethionine ribosyltransferase-isomerase QueA [Pacificimonas flava]|uniref:S-adenosylmethionine:tRNA ribosyltransferase-isomerase n=2 Tax=Pacificimonas TaxID=1960290 RepID=A0A219B261_9SPHN|nr:MULTISPECIES: tRNA preQ1(34) S-adenosylmethionine ribosyltransferase-isomerase QueA [Pacificimonas]MBZ6378151.1 tRNA preQ1(34) S-adenosylmethionine ribosyltransferase-isomerase QueA [Pacificimonas aurantium]OWV32216.1 tRNA preQ1(34) S-adenosylmethionine ribosyltransferase-isomerase QueA [Pacificimonas flava]